LHLSERDDHAVAHLGLCCPGLLFSLQAGARVVVLTLRGTRANGTGIFILNLNIDLDTIRQSFVLNRYHYSVSIDHGLRRRVGALAVSPGRP